MVWLVAAVLALGAVLGYRAHARRQAAESFKEVARLISESGHTARAQPDLMYAAEGYAGIAVVRKNNLPGDLAHLARANAWHAKRAGATELQVLSAYWGGVYAMEDDLRPFTDGLEAYEAAKRQLGREPTGDPKSKLYAAAATHLGTVVAAFPEEFSNFVRVYRGSAASL